MDNSFYVGLAKHISAQLPPKTYKFVNRCQWRSSNCQLPWFQIAYMDLGLNYCQKNTPRYMDFSRRDRDFCLSKSFGSGRDRE